MLSSLAEMTRRTRGRLTGRLQSLPILSLHVHTACNCRCVMCDIWKANASKREISVAALERHVAAIRALHVRRVMLTGGEPLLHSNLWALCDRLRVEGIRITLVTTGLLLEAHAAAVARTIDELVVSLDGPRAVHDRIRRVPGGFDRIARGLQSLRAESNPSVHLSGASRRYGPPISESQTRGVRADPAPLAPPIQASSGLRRPRLVARSVVQRANYMALPDTIESAMAIGVDRVSFLAADVFSSAFNRPTPWDDLRRADVALSGDDLPGFADAIQQTASRCRPHLEARFVVGGLPSLWRLHQYYGALGGQGMFPRVRCHAPWVSAVLEADGALRPCFFHRAYPAGEGLEATLNSVAAIRFRRELDVTRDDTCRRCVCSLALPLAQEP